MSLEDRRLPLRPMSKAERHLTFPAAQAFRTVCQMVSLSIVATEWPMGRGHRRASGIERHSTQWRLEDLREVVATALEVGAVVVRR